MTIAGFSITRLTLTGRGVPDAEVTFTDGLNVISGPSDTGKTFIAQCIDFMMGGSKAPKEIPQAASYESVMLGVRAKTDDKEYILERSLRGGDVRLHAVGEVDRILGEKHSAENENTVSYFLSNLSGLTGRKIRTNKLGKTRPLSFRDLARLILVDEETVISEESPIFSGQVISSTAEGAVFRLLLSGVDDSSVIAQVDPKVSRIRLEGKTEVIEVLVERTQEKIAELKLDGDMAFLREQFDSIEADIESATAELSDEQKSVATFEERRRSAWAGLRHVESRTNVLSELQQRFELLQTQYSSDLRRLQAISEAGLRLGQMKEERCPVCGAVAEHHNYEHQSAQASPDEVADACHAEAEKIRRLLTDLHNTLVDNKMEVKRLKQEGLVKQAELDAASNEIRVLLQPRVQAAVQKLRDSQSAREPYRQALDLYNRLEELKELISEGDRPRKAQRVDGASVVVGSGETEQFSKQVDALLRAWHFPNLDRVTFSDSDQDIVISGQQRASHGKGVRAITHAAFNIALLRYCMSRSMPHPGLVVIDSPLVVYREPDTDEGGFSDDVKGAFYRSLASDFVDAQIIILENEDPPGDVDGSANVIRFTGTELGRSGFIPK